MWKWIVIFLLIVTVLLCFQSCWWLKPGKKYKCLTRDGVDEYGNKYSKRYSQLSKTYKENSEEFDASECYVIRFDDLPEAQKYSLDELACVGEKDLEGMLFSHDDIMRIKDGVGSSTILLHILHKALASQSYYEIVNPAPKKVVRNKVYLGYYKDTFLQIIGYADSGHTNLLADKRGKKYVTPFGSSCLRIIHK